MVTSCVGITAAQMKVLRTFGGDKTSFTRLLRCLSPLGDAPGCTTYDDSGARLVCLKGEVTRSELRERHGLVSDVGKTSLEGASNRNPR